MTARCASEPTGACAVGGDGQKRRQQNDGRDDPRDEATAGGPAHGTPQNWTCGAVAAPACAWKYAFCGNLLPNMLAISTVGKRLRAVL